MGPWTLPGGSGRDDARDVEQLRSLDDIGTDDAARVVRLALLEHDRPGALAGTLPGAVVGLVLAPPCAAGTEARLRVAVRRLGAAARESETVDQGMECVVACPLSEPVRDRALELAIPTFDARTGDGDPWPALAEQVGRALVAAHRERDAVDGLEELTREAMVPTAAAVIAVLCGRPGPARTPGVVDLREETASYWFG